jgi:quinoprotein glucose dehydrogenase
MQGSPYVMLREVLLSPLGAPCNPPPWGQLTAIDMKTGQTRWQVPFGRLKLSTGLLTPSSWGAPNQGGPIVTRGGLVFIGASLDSVFRAYDIQTGRQVWYAAVPAPATATPMTFRHTDGRQYVVVSAGGHGGFGTQLSDALVAFALP